MDDRELRARVLAMAVEHSAKGLGRTDLFDLADGFYRWVTNSTPPPQQPEFMMVQSCPPVQTSDHRFWQCDEPVGHDGPHRNGDLEWWVRGEVID